MAQRAEEQGEVPVGTLVVLEGHCIAEGWNVPISTHDPSAHAEMVALRLAGKAMENYRLINSTLYVTLEPCVMCMGAIAHARVKRVVFGALDEIRGAICSALELANTDFLNHQIDWQGEVLAEACADLLRDFFRAKRSKLKAQ